VTIEASKDGVKFSANGDIGNGSVTLRSNQDVEKEENNIEIELTEPVALTFSLKYLVNFCKAQPLSNRVKVCLSNEVPLLVEYGLAGTSYLRFYLAPKVRVSSPSMALPLLVFGLLLTLESRLVMRSKDDGDNRYFC
jgi:proliferating cell nuclear antigen